MEIPDPRRRFRHLLDQEPDKSPTRAQTGHWFHPAPGWHSIAPPRGPPGTTPLLQGERQTKPTSGNRRAAGHLPGVAHGLLPRGDPACSGHSRSPIQQGSRASNAAYWGKPPEPRPNRSSQPEPCHRVSPANLLSRSPPAFSPSCEAQLVVFQVCNPAVSPLIAGHGWAQCNHELCFLPEPGGQPAAPSP